MEHCTREYYVNHKNGAQMNMEYVFEQEKYKAVDSMIPITCVCACGHGCVWVCVHAQIKLGKR